MVIDSKPYHLSISDNFSNLNTICSDNFNLYFSAYDKNYILGITIYNNMEFKIQLPFTPTCICYDTTENIFLCITNSNPNYIFQLNNKGEILGKIQLKNLFCSYSKVTITHISYNDKFEQIYLYVHEFKKIYIIDKLGALISSYYIDDEVKDLKVCDNYIFIYTTKNILILNKSFKKIAALKLPNIIGSCFLITPLCNYSYNVFIILGTFNKIKFFKFNLSSKEFLSANHIDCALSSNTSKHSCLNTNCCCNTNIADPQNIYDLIESIALEEAGLAHIINAEGEKIQKAIKVCDDSCELIAVNKSVTETLEQVVQFEMILNNKLKTAHELLKLLFNNISDPDIKNDYNSFHRTNTHKYECISKIDDETLSSINPIKTDINNTISSTSIDVTEFNGINFHSLVENFDKN
ncbi:MAG: hypothetical protein ACRC57_05080 [Sarcina sp.]